MPHLHPYAAAADPARIGAKNPPTLFDAVQKPQNVPRRASGYHDVRMRAQAGAPSPCSRPLTPQKSMKSGKDEEAPTQMLARAVAASPPPSSSVGCVRAPRTPDANLETPYMTGSTEVRAPTDWRRIFWFFGFVPFREGRVGWKESEKRGERNPQTKMKKNRKCLEKKKKKVRP